MAKRTAAEPTEDATSPLHPKCTEHLIARDAAEKQLLALIQAKRLPHALLLSGPRGTGKATLAWRLARFLLKPEEAGASLFGDALPPESLHVPSSHPVFRRIIAGSHPDLLVLESEDIKIEEARKVGEFLSLTPAESERRIVIIDSADAMNRNAANALLKVLEEPPSRAVLLLISHNPGALLPTIRSRCRMLRMPPLEEADFVRIMAHTAPHLSPEECRNWSKLSGGSPGIAGTLIDCGADELYRELLERMTVMDAPRLHGFADRLARKDHDPDWQAFSRLFPWLLHRIASPQPSVPAADAEDSTLERLRRAKPLGEWLDLAERAGTLISDAGRLHLDRKQTVLTLLRAAS